MKKFLSVVTIMLGFSAAYNTWADDSSTCGYSFTHKPFISPMIIADLETWESDNGEQIVSINLPESMGTNRYFGDYKASGVTKFDPAPTVTYEDDSCTQDNGGCMAPPYNSYMLLGKTADNVYALYTSDGGGGTGEFENLLLVTFEKSRGFKYDATHQTLTNDRPRCLITRLSEIPLGDRSVGDIAMKGNIITIHTTKDFGIWVFSTRENEVTEHIRVPTLDDLHGGE